MYRYRRKVIQIKAEHSPNVRRGLRMLAQGLTPDDAVIIPGVVTYSDYCSRRELWDIPRQTVGLDAEFYQGPELLLFPPHWLNECHEVWESLRGKQRKAEAIGIDTAEGGDRTSMCAGDRKGIIELVSKKTPNTAVITGEAINFMLRHDCPPDKVVFDRGGGGLEHVDRLNAQGYPVRSVTFSEAVSLEPKYGQYMLDDKLEQRNERSIYPNRRVQMYHEASQLCDPSINEHVHGIPRIEEGEQYNRLRRQLAVFPKVTDQDGRFILPPKSHKGLQDPNKSRIRTLIEMIGHSPDEADSFVLMVHGLLLKSTAVMLGAF